MLTVHIASYSESDDKFRLSVIDSANDCAFDTSIAASFMPYIASELCSETDDLPFGLVGQHFTMTSPLID